jgi:HSP20 family protein
MAIVHFSPFTEMETLRRQFDRMLDEFGHVNVFGDGNLWKPAVELLNTKEALILKVSLPGIDAKDLDISVTRESVRISGEKRYEKTTEEDDFFHSEFRYGKFERTIGLPVPIQNGKVTADYKDGVLVINLPKIEEEVNRVVKINLGGETEKVKINPEDTQS